MTPAALATLTAANVFNVEGLAEMSDATAEVIGPIAYQYRDMAQAYLEKTSGENKELTALRDQNKSLAENQQKQDEQIKALEAKLEALSKPKRRGRPPGSRNKVKRNVSANNDPRDNGPAESADA